MTGTSCLRRGSQVAMIKRHMEHTDISAIHFESHLPHLVKDGRCVTADKTETTVQDGVPPFGIVKLVNILRGEISWPFLLVAKASKKKKKPWFLPDSNQVVFVPKPGQTVNTMLSSWNIEHNRSVLLAKSITESQTRCKPTLFKLVVVRIYQGAQSSQYEENDKRSWW